MKVRWGIFGTGEISAKFVESFHYVQNAEITFVASRSKKNAEKFASIFNIPNAIEGYYEASKAKLADIVYIATPVYKHEEHSMMCIEQNVSIMVEKPFAMNSNSAKKISKAAISKSLFAMEAMWTRFLPTSVELKRRVQKKEIGDIRMVSGSFGVSKHNKFINRAKSSYQNNGSLFQLGIYPLSLSQWLFGDPSSIQALGNINNKGIDEDFSFQVRFKSGVIGNFHSSISSWSENNFQIMGTHGKISFNGPVVRPYGISIAKHKPLQPDKKNNSWFMRFRQKGLVNYFAQQLGKSSNISNKNYKYFYKGNGYHYQILEANFCILNAYSGSNIMPLSDSICILKTMEKLINIANRKRS
jgi:predicted dehydrogenase